MQTESIKQEAYNILDNLPDKATWDDLMYKIYVRQTIEVGIKDSNEGRTVDVKKVLKKFGLAQGEFTGQRTQSGILLIFMNILPSILQPMANGWWTELPYVPSKSLLIPFQAAKYRNMKPRISGN